MSKLLFIVNAVVVLALGLALMFAPEATLNQFGAETRVAELHMARFLGAALATLGLLLWFAKDAPDETVQKGTWGTPCWLGRCWRCSSRFSAWQPAALSVHLAGL
ncbi:MAG TPA: DUF4345 family protein [Anaerolineales bacterium]|nr:DUF4345 family protein [Anaerolineales bacterium]